MPDYLAIEVSLSHVKPRIWRSFLISADATFFDLHQAIQDACGWEDSHLFAFRDARGRKDIAGIPDPDYDDRVPDAETVKLKKYFTPRGPTACEYEYDFGDGWMHEVVLKDRVTFDDAFVRRLTGGERAFPPEDCGGLGGYERCLAFRETGKDPLGDGDEEFGEWLGDWQPEEFDLVAVKKSFDRPKHGFRTLRGGRGAAKESGEAE
jgi:hypothetical protein